MPASTEPMPPEIWAQVNRFTHLYQHFVMRKRGHEAALIADCWGLVWDGFDSLPDWAAEAADTGQPGTRWCPIITPELRTRAASTG